MGSAGDARANETNDEPNAADAKPNDADNLRPTSDVPSDATNAGYDAWHDAEPEPVLWIQWRVWQHLHPCWIWLEGKEATVEDRVVTVVLEGREVMVVLEGTIVLIEEGMGVIARKGTSTPTRWSIPK